ncbi:MAG: hypothetical protein SGPRY_011650, partial [Prymnesium sp.]
MYSPPEENALYNALPSYMAYLGVRSIKFVFPRAPRRTAHLESQSRRVHAVLDREAQILGGDMSRVMLGGSSQGGTVSLHAAISYGRPLGGAQD